MRKPMRIGVVALTAPLLAGCFYSNVSLYQGVPPLHPFRDGQEFTGVDGGKTETYTMREAGAGVYHFVESGPGNDKNNDVPHRFFALPGAPAGILVDEVAGQIYCPHPKTNKDTTCPVYQYALWRKTQRGEDITDPDCSKVKGAATLSVGANEAGKDCAFKSRATLERALRLAAAANLKPAFVLVAQK